MTQTRALPLFFILSLLLLVAAGCSTLPITGPLPDNLTAEKLGSIEEAAPFAISPDGNLVAFVNAGLKLLHLPTREQLEIMPERAAQLAWSPFGASLAASFYHEGKSTIITCDQHGVPVARAMVDGRITALDWLSENELVAASIAVTTYKFGSNYKSILHRWQPGRGGPQSGPLRDTTFQPGAMAKLRPILERGPMPAVYPPGGQILYLHPNAPPLFAPYYKLVLRELATDREMEIASLDLFSAGGKFTADGEKVAYVDAGGETVFFNPWSEEITGRVRTPGNNLETAPAGDYWFADGTLFRGDSAVAPLAPGGVGKFSPNGQELFIASRGELFRLTGLRPPAPSMFETSPAKILQLRSWKMEGLISAGEYRDAIKKVSKP